MCREMKVSKLGDLYYEICFLSVEEYDQASPICGPFRDGNGLTSITTLGRIHCAVLSIICMQLMQFIVIEEGLCKESSANVIPIRVWMSWLRIFTRDLDRHQKQGQCPSAILYSIHQ